MELATVVIIACLWAALGIWIFFSREKKPKPDPLADAAWEVIEASLYEQPEEWQCDDYRLANHRRRISIWIANGAYSVGIRLDGHEASPGDGDMSAEWKARIFKAFRRRQFAEIANRFREEETPWAKSKK